MGRYYIRKRGYRKWLSSFLRVGRKGVLFHFVWGKLSGKRSRNGLAPHPGFSRRSRALLLGGEELASRPRFYGRSPGSSDNFAGRLLPSRLPSKEDSGRLNPPWSLRPFPDRFPFLPTRNGREPKKELSNFYSISSSIFSRKSSVPCRIFRFVEPQAGQTKI